jgi:hypothetical protein
MVSIDIIKNTEQQYVITFQVKDGSKLADIYGTLGVHLRED